MKKLVSMVLIALILISGVVVIADEIDLSAYSDDAIIELNEKVQLEVVKRGLGKMAAFARGKYTVGDYIPAGLYILKATGTGGWDWGNITVRTPEDQEDAPSKLDKFVSEFYPYVGFLILDEGDILESPVLFTLTIVDPTVLFK